MDKKQKPLLFFLSQGKLMADSCPANGKTIFQIRLPGTEFMEKVCMNENHNALMPVTDMPGKVLPFLPVHEKNSSRFKIIDILINDKMFPVGDGVINLAAVLNTRIAHFFLMI